jgi:uncharacterized membrane protein YobD (UPF0266 family)
MQSKNKKNDDLFSWVAPTRPFKKRDASFYITAGILAVLLIMIAFFIKQWLLIAAILAVVFVSYVLASVPPTEERHKITKKGLWVGDVFFKYSAVVEFWFEEHLDSVVLVLVVIEKQPTKLQVVIPKDQKEVVYDLLLDHCVYREEPVKNFFDNTADWLRNKFPLESKPHHHKSA